MTKVRRIFWFVLLTCHIFPISVNSRPNCLNNRTYSDKHTGRLECCSDLCEDANYKGTEHQCQLKCPGYVSAPEKQPEILPAVSKDGTISPTGVALISVACIAVATVVVVAGALTAVRYRRKHPTPQNPADDVEDGSNNSLINDTGNDATNNEPSYRPPEQTAQPETPLRAPIQISQQSIDLAISQQAEDNQAS